MICRMTSIYSSMDFKTIKGISIGIILGVLFFAVPGWVRSSPPSIPVNDVQVGQVYEVNGQELIVKAIDQSGIFQSILFKIK